MQKNDIVIALMGVTGAGKSTFINHFCEGFKIGNGLMSCTQEVKPYMSHTLTRIARRCVWLVDTPGFDDSTRTDTEVLRDIAAFLSDTYHDQILLTGIVYLHRISDNRVGGTGFRQMQMFHKLCGADNMGNIALGTTMWSTVQGDDGVRREQELMTQDGFWKRLIEQGASVFRQDRGSDSAKEIVLDLIRKKHPVVFDIQKEMVDGNKRLDETAAGIELSAEVLRQQQRYEKELQSIKSEMQEALKAKDDELSKELRSVKEEVERKLAQEREAAKRLQASRDDLYRQMEEQRLKDQEMWQRILEERDEADEIRDREHRKEMSKMMSQVLAAQAQAQAAASAPPKSSSKSKNKRHDEDNDDFERLCCRCGETEKFSLKVGRWHGLKTCGDCGHGCGVCSYVKLSSTVYGKYYYDGTNRNVAYWDDY